MKWWSRTQPTIALSSGEAELAALIRATSEGLGMQAMMHEFGLESQLKIKGDAVAAMGMVKRQGLGRVRHLAVADLWIQQKAKEGVAKFEKLPGTENTSDIMTKAVESDVLAKHVKTLGFEYREGRHKLTPDYDGLDDGTLDFVSKLLQQSRRNNLLHSA